MKLLGTKRWALGIGYWHWHGISNGSKPARYRVVRTPFLRLKKSRAKSTFKGLLFFSVPSSWWYYDTPRLHTVRREARANALNQKVVRPVLYVSQMNGCNLYQRLNVNHRGNRRGTVVQYSTVLHSVPIPTNCKGRDNVGARARASTNGYQYPTGRPQVR